MAKKMHHLNVGNETYEIMDPEARLGVDEEATARQAADATINSRIDELVTEHSYPNPETVLWTGDAHNVDDLITLSEPATNFDYIDVYFKYGTIKASEIRTYKSEDFVSAGAVIVTGYIGNATPNPMSIDRFRIESISGSTTNFKVTMDAEASWTGNKNADSVLYEATGSIWKVVGRKIVTNLEVEDIRVGVDGTTYESAGAAVRGQINKLSDDLEAELETVVEDLEAELEEALVAITDEEIDNLFD